MKLCIARAGAFICTTARSDLNNGERAKRYSFGKRQEPDLGYISAAR
jgi:hypothetical protein